MKQLYLALVAPLLISAAPALDKSSRKDLRCIIGLQVVINQALANKDQTLADKTETAQLYYLGRLDGRVPALNLQKALSEEKVALFNEQYDRFSLGKATEAEAVDIATRDLINIGRQCGIDMGKRALQFLDAYKASGKVQK